ncbi:hypothetical protein V5R04_06795 [Jonesiaceae bacterium BS-20]|uniref:Uncharacterized protein n=1 Tax=Jonesiaceae bacterium BS-20 TaxID=3120821 RepID=A0AAU7DZH5_9MICO
MSTAVRIQRPVPLLPPYPTGMPTVERIKMRTQPLELLANNPHRSYQIIRAPFELKVDFVRGFTVEIHRDGEMIIPECWGPGLSLPERELKTLQEPARDWTMTLFSAACTQVLYGGLPALESWALERGIDVWRDQPVVGANAQ